MEQLQGLLQSIWSEEVRQNAGFKFSEGALLVSVAGGQSVTGGAPLDLVVSKVEGIQALFFRTVEFLQKQPHRKRGPAPVDVQNICRPWLFQAAPGSYQFAIAIEDVAQRSLFGPEVPSIEEIKETFVALLRDTAEEPETALAERVPNKEYRGTFLKLTRALAPTGKDFSVLTVRRSLENPARSLKRPRILEVNDVVPYTFEQIVAILAACGRIGRNSYERRRAHAMVLLMRYTGLRISDVVTLSRDHIRGARLEKHAIKNNRWIRVELPPAVLQALELLPHPKAAPQDNRRFFAKDTANLRSLVKGAWRTLAAVFKLSGVERAHPHRFRHTLASELLAKGGTLQEVAGILGHSPTTIARHYAKWTPEYQARQDVLIRKIHGTSLAQAEEGAARC